MTAGDETSLESFDEALGLGLTRRICDRASRLARALFPGDDAQIVLTDGSRLWRSRDFNGDYGQFDDLVARECLRTGEAIWVEDGAADPRFKDGPLVAGPPYPRFYAGAPLRLADGRTPGVIAVYGVTPRTYDVQLAARLSDLADFVADEWARAQADEARQRNARERDAVLETLKSVVRTAPVMLLLMDTSLRILGCSGRWAEQFGIEADMAQGRLLSEVAPERFSAWGDIYRRCLAGETITAQDVPFTRKGGGRGWLAVELTPWRDASGAVGGLIASSHDVTDTISALRRSERAEQRLTLALEHADIHVYDIDYERKEVFKAGSEERFFGQTMSFDQLASDIWSTIHPEDRPVAKAAWKRHLTTGAPYCPEYRINWPDGKELWVISTATLTLNEKGEPQRLIGALQNITARKASEKALLQAKEEAEAANRAKSTFLATMSHEIRTPLNGVLGMAQAMAADALSDTQRERVDVIRHSGESLLAILNDVLDLSKIEAGKLELEEVEFDMVELARGAHAAFSAVAEKKGLAFRLDIDPSAHGVYLGDSTRVRQILYNLVSNALKFTEAGEVRVNVEGGPDVLRLTVADTGIGIDRNRMAALFQKFEQADASTTRRYGGTGLGLSICRELVQLMGGVIAADSHPGRGAVFRVSLPLPRISEAGCADSGSAPVGSDAAEGGEGALRVLAAEDNEVNRLVLKTLLAQAGVHPTIVENGLEAVAAWRRSVWDVILMDVQMPEMDGPTATAAIRAAEAAEGRARTPIIALTANAMAHQVASYKAAGMDGFVAKPIEVARLFAAIREAVETREPAERAA